jgi:hypothetical protein
MSVNYNDQIKVFLEELNKFRKNPQAFIPLLEKMKTQLKNNVLYRDGEHPIETHEGVVAIDNAIKRIKLIDTLIEPLWKFELDDKLSKAAKLHLDDINDKGLLSHQGSDGGFVADRIEKFYEWQGVCAENIEFGTRGGLNVLLASLVDDGIKDKGHRNNLINPRFSKIGVAAGPHKQHDSVFVIVFVEEVREKDKPYFNKDTYKQDYPADFLPKAPRKIKNKFQNEDQDAPDNTIAVKVVKQTKTYNGKSKNVTKKYYTLSDGSTAIVEVEDLN